MVFQVSAFPSTSGGDQPDLVVFYAIPRDDERGPRLDFSVIGASVLRADNGRYQEDWSVQTQVDSPFSNRENDFRYHDLFDLTGDGQAEMVIGGCDAWTSPCAPVVKVWLLSGPQIFRTAFRFRFEGVWFLEGKGVIVTVRMLGAFSRAVAPTTPQWEVVLWRWDGSAFVQFDRQIFLRADYPQGPPLPLNER